MVVVHQRQISLPARPGSIAALVSESTHLAVSAAPAGTVIDHVTSASGSRAITRVPSVETRGSV